MNLSFANKAILCFFTFLPATAQEQHFTDVTEEAGLNFRSTDTYQWVGVAAADYDNDDWVDLLVTRSGGGPNLLYRNNGDGTFTDRAIVAGVAMFATPTITGLFFDYDGDGLLDLFGGVLRSQNHKLFRNRGDGTFEDVSSIANISLQPQLFAATAGDYDRDGDLDLYLSMNRLGAVDPGGVDQLWRNDGGGFFTQITELIGLAAIADTDRGFSSAFADINNDSWPDLLAVSDFNTSQVYLNQKDGTFANTTNRDVITDDSGMGCAVGDYDNDGDLDWFVSCIWDNDQDPEKPWGVSTGNRLYRNKGDGSFEDATDEAGVRVGYWGWGSVFADLNHDGHLDIFHVNGFIDPAGPFFESDPSRCFMSNGNGTFAEQSAELGLDHTGLGNGVAAFDYDGDGDLDLFLGNATGGSKLYRNDGGNRMGSVMVRTLSSGRNKRGIGSHVRLITPDGKTQLREISINSNYVSQSPDLAHFGMGSETTGDIDIRWPDGIRNKLFGVRAGETIVFPQMPVSFDDPSRSFFKYYWATNDALKNYLTDGVISEREHRRFLYSAVKAFYEDRYGKQ